jgi:hypothetical protein
VKGDRERKCEGPRDEASVNLKERVEGPRAKCAVGVREPLCDESAGKEEMEKERKREREKGARREESRVAS